MNTFNNFSPLAFREKSMKATYKKWYAYGKEFALPFSTTELPPFQFTVANLPSFDPTTVEVFLVNEATGVRTGTGIKIKVDTMDEHNSVLYVSPGSNVYAKSVEPGVYRAEFTIPEGETYVSTPICVTDGIETNTNFVKLEYWNDEKLAYPNGFITTGTDNDFKFQMYIPTTFFKPKYEFEEEITKRAGYKFLELQTCNKVFGFNFLAPEYICDALRLVRLSDYIRFSHDGEYYNALNFEYTPDWQDNGYLAAIECQFETDTIIQKLPSFNRRDRESFYNALLADIDTPILFSPDVVGLYYREYKQGEPTIKGKLIRELSPIDLIDENTTIAVDMGAGEARKFNLYRMLEGYISKNHEDVTEFLLSLRGGVNIGTPNTSGEYPASVDRDGNAKLKDIQGNDATLNKVTGKDATFKTVETGFLTVNKTSATIDGMGNANVNDLTARGDSMLRSDVYTGSKNGSHTGKITKEGQLQYLSAIIYEFLSSETFIPGFLGEGFKIWVENGNWHIECDNLTVRQTMNIFELLIQKIRSVNGAIVVSQSNGKVTAVEDTGTQYKITFGEEFPTFQEGDLIRCQSWSKNNLKFYWVEVKTAADGYVLCDKSEFNNVVPAVGDEVVQMGNTKNAERQALIYITAQESGKPYIEILNGVKTKSLTGTDRTRLGDLSNIVDPDFTGEAAVKGTGFYSTNAFLKGIFVLRNGKRVEDEIKIAKDAADKAAQDAANAAQSAQEAKDRLNKWADDGFISPTEKPALIDEGKRIQAEYLQIKANADKYGVLVTEYTEAYNNYLNELRYHSAATPEDIAVRPELAQSQTAYYDKRNGALNAIAKASKDYVDNADKQLKEYLDTEITAIPGKIELAVRSLKVADTNILKGAYTELKTLAYAIGYYSYDSNVITGKKYILTLCYTLGEGIENITPTSKSGAGALTPFTTKGNRVIESKEVVITEFDKEHQFQFYQFPNGTYGSKVHWAVLTDGNLGVTSWIPSASEKNVGLKNLCSFKRITDVKFTYASRYGDDGTFLIDAPLLHNETLVANNDMFGLTYKGDKRYYIFVDYFNPTTTIPSGVRSIFFRVIYTDGATSEISVFSDRIENNFLLTEKPIRRIVGSYGTGINVYTRIGVYETNFPVSWSPAPEDQLYQSVKYTDTQILAIDGKIELSVKTKLEKTTIGGNNLIDGSKGYWFNGSDYRDNVSLNYNPSSSNGCMSVLGSGWFNCHKPWMNVDKTEITPGKQYTLGIDVSIGGNYVHETGLFFNIRYNEGGTIKYVADKTIVLTNDTKWTRYYVTLDLPSVLPSGITVNDLLFLCGFTGKNTGTGAGLIVSYKNINLVEGGIGTSWSPSANDTFGKSVEYTNQQISIVEGKITTTVEKLTEVDGKVTGLASRVTQTENSITSVVGDINVLNSTTNRHVTKQIDLVGWDNNKFFPLVIDIPVGHKSKVEINRPLNHAYGRPSYGTNAEGFSMNLSFEMSGSGWGSSIVVTNIFDYVRSWSNGKIVVDLGQITESSKCVMGIRGGSKYDVTVYDTTDKSTVNVYQTDYTGPFGQVVPVRTDGTEPVRTYGYYSEIKQTQESISATVAKVDDQGRRLSAAELTLSADHAKLSVVETTANNANSLAGTANNKAEAADGRVTATQNGLVETGINITSRKIVLKSDNVLFQNNAGQQTAAINANGKLTANAIEVGEVVAGGFAAQRITTGNLTVTDGAVIGGMTITGGVLTGKNINIQDGAKIGNFTIVSGIFSAQNTPAGIQMTLSNNAATFDSNGVRVEHNSGGYALTTTGNGRVFLTGSNFWVQCKDVDFMGAQTWKAPGVFYACTILANGAIGKTWGNPDFHITRVTKNSTGRYTVNTTGSNGDYFVMITAYNVTSWLSTTVEPYSEGQFTYKVFDVNNGMTDSAVIIYFCGMVK
nr:MAG TPA: tail protein [Caudoviricetes sp.]